MRAICWVCLYIALIPSFATAGAFEVAPTTIQMHAGARYATLFITNRGTEPVSAQIEAFDWAQADMTDKLTPSESLIVSPPMVRLLPGHKQTVRLAVDPAATASKERSFRVVVSELPDAAAKASDGVQVLLRFSVPLFAAAEAKRSLRLEWNITPGPDGFLLTALNTGNVHAKLSDILLTTDSAKDIRVTADSVSYVLAGMSRAWKIELAANLAVKNFTLKAHDEVESTITSSIAPPH